MNSIRLCFNALAPILASGTLAHSATKSALELLSAAGAAPVLAVPIALIWGILAGVGVAYAVQQIIRPLAVSTGLRPRNPSQP